MTPSHFIPSWLYVQLWSDQLVFALEKKSGNYLSLLNMCHPSDSAVCTTLVPLYASLLHSISDPIVPGRSSDISHCRETHHLCIIIICHTIGTAFEHAMNDWLMKGTVRFIEM